MDIEHSDMYCARDCTDDAVSKVCVYCVRVIQTNTIRIVDCVWVDISAIDA